MGEQHTVCNAQDNDSFALGNHTKLPKKTNNCINKLHRPLAPPRGRPYVDACATGAQQEARPMRGLGSAVGWVRPGRLEIRVQAALPVGIEDAIDDFEVVDGAPVLLRVYIRAAPFEVGCSIACGQQVVGAEIGLLGPQAAELGEQSGSLGLGCVIRLVGSEETPQRG